MVADPMDALETAELLWSADGRNTLHSSNCICIGNSDSIGNTACERMWLATVPGMDKPGTLEYRFRGRTGHQTVETGWFACRLGQSYTIKEVVSWTRKEAGLELVCAASAGTQVRLGFEFRAGSLRVALVWGEDGQGDNGRGLRGTDGSGSRSQATAGGIPGELSFCSDGLELRIETQELRFRVMDAAGTVLLSSKGPIRASEQFTPDGRMLTLVTLDFDSPVNEGYYGFGERYNRLDQRGELLYNRVFEQYRNQKLKTYLPIPFFFTNRNWGLLIETDRLVEFDLAARHGDTWSMAAEAVDTLELCFFFGQPRDIIKAYHGVEGKAELPPDWVFGPWMSSNEWNSQSRVLEVARQTAELDIPASVLVIEAWSDETTFYTWNDAVRPACSSAVAPKLRDFSFPAEGRWPDPKAMVDALHEQGIRLVLWQIPVIKEIGPQEEHEQHRMDEAYVQEHDLVLSEGNGKPYQVRPGWFRGSMMIDFAKAEAREWWFSRRRYLIDELGVDGFKTDGGEHIWGYELDSPSGAKGDELINGFPRDYLAAYTEELKKHRKGGSGAIFSRAGYRGAHRTPIHWAGDQDSSWDAYRGVVYSMLNANLSGISFIGWDIGGFTGPIPSVELYLRSAAAAVFSPLMQYHSEYNHHRSPIVDRTPWNLAERWNDDRALTVYRFLAHLRLALQPYILAEAAQAVAAGEPLMRPLFLDWPQDGRAWKTEDEYLFGRYLLIAPIMEEGSITRGVYLPEGSWIDVWTGMKLQGLVEIQAQAGLDCIPVYLKTGGTGSHVPGPEVFSAIRSKWS
jgi:alpha-glucosidase (family GH31 glycosyl hydrolase)